MKALISFSAPLSVNYTTVATYSAGEQSAHSPLQQIRHQIRKNRRRRRLWWAKMTDQDLPAADEPG
jgi:hypothetical protein